MTNKRRTIINLDELDKDIIKALTKVNENNYGYILSEGEPIYAIMDIKRFKKLLNLLREEVKYKDNELNRILNQIGKKVFIDFYYIFKNDNNPVDFLAKEGFSLSSSRNRYSGAIRIFTNNLEIDALKYILKSYTVDSSMLSKAKDILLKETGALPESYIDNNTLDNHEIKIGKAARSLFVRLLQGNYLTYIEIINLTEIEYSKRVFNLNFPVLKIVDSSKPIKEQKCDHKGYNRYYDNPIVVGEIKYLLCSQWIEFTHREHLDNWIMQKLFLILKYEVKKLENGSVFCVQKVLNLFWDYLSCNVKDSIESDFYQYALKQDNIKLTKKKDNTKSYAKIK